MSTRNPWIALSFKDVPHQQARVTWTTQEEQSSLKGSTTGTLILELDDIEYTYDNIIHLWYLGIRMYQHLPDRAYRLLAGATRKPPFLPESAWNSYEPSITDAFETGEYFDEERFLSGSKSALSAALAVSPRDFEKYHEPEVTGPALAMASLRHRGTWQMTTMLDAFESLEPEIEDIEQEYLQMRQKIRSDMMPLVVDPLRLPNPYTSNSGTQRDPVENPAATYDS